MNRPTYCRTYGKRIGECRCFRCRPATKPAPVKPPVSPGSEMGR